MGESVRLVSILAVCCHSFPNPFCVETRLSVFRRTLNLFTRRPSTLPRFAFNKDGWRDGSDAMDGDMTD